MTKTAWRHKEIEIYGMAPSGLACARLTRWGSAGQGNAEEAISIGDLCAREGPTFEPLVSARVGDSRDACDPEPAVRLALLLHPPPAPPPPPPHLHSFPY